MKSLTHTNDSTDQGTADWRQNRAGCVTGSGFAKLFTKAKAGATESKTRQTYRLQLVTERLTGIPMEEVSAGSLSWGKDNEDAARIAYEMYMANMGQHIYVDRAGFQQHKELNWVGTSPDGLVGEHGMIEIKCPYNTSVHLLTIISASKKLAAALLNAKDEPLIQVPEEHLPQIQGNLWVLDRQWCDFISYDPRLPPHLQLYVARVERDETYIATLREVVEKFLDDIEDNMQLLLQPEDNFPSKEGE